MKQTYSIEFKEKHVKEYSQECLPHKLQENWGSTQVPCTHGCIVLRNIPKSHLWAAAISMRKMPSCAL